MKPNEALHYLSQLASDYVRSLPPSAAAPTQQCAQQAVEALAAALLPAPPTETAERPPLRTVSSSEP